jgi:hypothetical protein
MTSDHDLVASSFYKQFYKQLNTTNKIFLISSTPRPYFITDMITVAMIFRDNGIFEVDAKKVAPSLHSRYQTR